MKPTLTVQCWIQTKMFLNTCETAIKKRFKLVRSHSATLNIMMGNYQKSFGKLNNTMEHQKLYGRYSEYAVLSIHTIGTTFYF